MKMLPQSLLTLLLLALPALSHASPNPALVPAQYLHLLPRNTLFLRQLSDLQTFDGALGGFRASPITNSGDEKRPFEVEGDTFDSFEAAAQRSCDRQFKDCSDAANGDGGGGLEVQQCDQQKSTCMSTQQSATTQNFQDAVRTEFFGQDPDFPDFDLFCDA